MFMRGCLKRAASYFIVMLGCMRRTITFLFLIVAAGRTFAQNQSLQEVELDSIAAQNERLFIQNRMRAQEYAMQHSLPLGYSNEFRTVSLVGVDDGVPVYLATDNIEAAVTTGVVKLRGGNPLGVDLQGFDMRVGVWDGGKVAHTEFENRILFTEGANNDNHATHVTGTIAAAGITNPDIRGMAPKAKILSYDFNNALSEMASLAKPNQSSIILSNHSYGFVTGWDCTVNPCQWRGNPTVSTLEDFRFGFYSNNTREWDRIANNAPYYLMVKSAGNDRSDRGANGAVYPPDGNGGSGYDCIEEQATAKNILTVGAVNPVFNYQDAASVVMSSFSSWGPTDDGRIKPDIVADGVGLLSTTLNNGFGRLSGTSMSSPNVTGTLALLQELHKKLNGGNYMLSSTVKALAIHTAREAGINPGPDYSFGWGLLDAEAAAQTLLNRDDQNIFIRELTLRNGEVFNLSLSPKANTKITVTMAWNDPAGTPVANSLDPPNLMLVNDLDVRILDGQTVAQFPWSLNPEVPSLGQPATKSDNFRDNVEKIEFESPEAKIYTLSVSHKGILRGNSQVLSLIVTYTSMTPKSQTLYWVGGTGDWNDSNHWSLSSGGPPASQIPTSDTRSIIDENSFLNDGEILFSSNANCQELMAISSSEKVSLNLNGNTLNVTGDLIISDSTFVSNSAGIINLSSAKPYPSSVNLYKSKLQNLKLLFNGNAFSLNATGSVGTIELTKGFLDMGTSNLAVSELLTSGSQAKTMVLTNATLTNLVNSTLSNAGSSTVLADSVQISTSNSAGIFNWNNVTFNGRLTVNSSDFVLNGNNLILRVRVNGKATLGGNNQINDLVVAGGAAISLMPGTTQTLSSKVFMLSNSVSRISIQSTDQAYLRFDGKYRLCFDYLNVSKVSLIGSASVNAGLNSTIVDSQNWFQDECQNVIVPDFDVLYGCVGARTQLTDSSIGLINNYQWEVSPPGSLIENANTKVASMTFSTAKPYLVKLTVSNSKFSKSIEKSVNVRPNDLNENQILLNGLNLFSRESGNSYQWLKDNQIISSSNSRSFLFNGVPGTYNVITFSQQCNRVSVPFVITSSGENGNTLAEPRIYPNPANSSLVIDYERPISYVQIFDLMGRVVAQFKTDDTQFLQQVDISSISPGVFVVELGDTSRRYQFKILISR